MKKVIALAAAAVLASGAFAEGFKLSGFLRAGWSNTIDALDTNADGDGDTAEASTATWLAGDYFGGSTRSRINLAWSNEGDTAGAYVRLQYTGAAESWTLDKVKYANVWAKCFDGKVLAAVGKVQDNYLASDGFEGFSFLDGNSGFFAGVAPVEGLVIGGGAVVDYLKNSYYVKKDDGTYEEKDDKHRASKRAVYAGAKYTNDQFSVAGAYEFAGALYGNVNITAVENLLIALEAAWQDEDERSNELVGYDSELTFVEQVEYTGIEKLTLGVASYQYLNKAEVSDTEDSLVVTITPAVRYDINDLFAASVEATLNLYSWDEDKVGDVKDTYATIVPTFYINAAKGAEITLWGVISTDTDQANHAVGLGGKFAF